MAPQERPGSPPAQGRRRAAGAHDKKLSRPPTADQRNALRGAVTLLVLARREVDPVQTAALMPMTRLPRLVDLSPRRRTAGQSALGPGRAGTRRGQAVEHS